MEHSNFKKNKENSKIIQTQIYYYPIIIPMYIPIPIYNIYPNSYFILPTQFSYDTSNFLKPKIKKHHKKNQKTIHDSKLNLVKEKKIEQNNNKIFVNPKPQEKSIEINSKLFKNSIKNEKEFKEKKKFKEEEKEFKEEEEEFKEEEEEFKEEEKEIKEEKKSVLNNNFASRIGLIRSRNPNIAPLNPLQRGFKKSEDYEFVYNGDMIFKKKKL